MSRLASSSLNRSRFALTLSRARTDAVEPLAYLQLDVLAGHSGWNAILGPVVAPDRSGAEHSDRGRTQPAQRHRPWNPDLERHPVLTLPLVLSSMCKEFVLPLTCHPLT